MITYQQAFEQGLISDFTSDPDFVISSKSDMGAEINILEMLKLKDLLNTSLSVTKYSSDIDNITLTYLLLSPDNKGVNWQERKYYRRSEKKYYIDIRFPDYEKFCTATKDEALSMMAQQTIRATDKYLSKEKFFKYNEFKNDLVDVFKRNGLIES